MIYTQALTYHIRNAIHALALAPSLRQPSHRRVMVLPPILPGIGAEVHLIFRDDGDPNTA